MEDATPSCSKPASTKRTRDDDEIERIFAASDQALQAPDSTANEDVAPPKKKTRRTKPLLLSTTGTAELADFAQQLRDHPPPELEPSTDALQGTLHEEGCYLEIRPTAVLKRGPLFPDLPPPTTVHERLRRNEFYLIKTYQTRHSAFYEYGTLCLKGVQAITIEEPLMGVPPAVEMDRVVYPFRKLPSGGLYFFLPAQMEPFLSENLSRW